MFKSILVAAALIVSPMAAHAMTLSDSDLTDMTFDDPAGVADFTSATDVFRYGEVFNPGDAVNGNTADFEIRNNTGHLLKINVGQPATVNPGNGISPAATFALDLGGGFGAFVEVANGNLFASIANGASATLRILFGNIVQPLTDVDVRISAVPLPAGLLLFSTALAGLGFAARRRRKNASVA